MFYREGVQRDDTTGASREDRMFRSLKNAMEPKVRFTGRHQSFSKFQSEYSRELNLINTGRALFGCWPSPFWLQLKSSQRPQERGFGSVLDAQPVCFCGLWWVQLRMQQALHECGEATRQTHRRRISCSLDSDSSLHSWNTTHAPENLSSAQMNRFTELKPGPQPCPVRCFHFVSMNACWMNISCLVSTISTQSF